MKQWCACILECIISITMKMVYVITMAPPPAVSRRAGPPALALWARSAGAEHQRQQRQDGETGGLLDGSPEPLSGTFLPDYLSIWMSDWMEGQSLCLTTCLSDYLSLWIPVSHYLSVCRRWMSTWRRPSPSIKCWRGNTAKLRDWSESTSRGKDWPHIPV